MKTELDGIEVREVRDIDLSFRVDDAAKLKLTIFVEKPFEWEGDANVYITKYNPLAMDVLKNAGEASHEEALGEENSTHHSSFAECSDRVCLAVKSVL